MEASKYIAQTRKLLEDFMVSTEGVDFTDAERASMLAMRDLLEKTLEVLTKA